MSRPVGLLPGGVRLVAARSANLLGAAGLAAFLVLSCLVAWRVSVLDQFDQAAVTRLTLRAGVRSGWLTGWRMVTYGGDGVVPALAGVLIAGYAFRSRRWETLRYLVATGLVSMGIRLVVRYMVARPRPSHRLTDADGWSYPSGHTLYSGLGALALLVVGLELTTGQWQRLVLISGCLTWMVSVGVSRVVLAVHWPTDILGSWLLLGSTALICLPFYFSLRRPPGSG